VLAAHPNILKTFTRQLVEAVKRLSFQFNYEQERQAVLRPYLVTRAKRGVIGRSRYAERLRNQIRDRR
jgi:transcriptional regulator with AAA-type ATPase domain